MIVYTYDEITKIYNGSVQINDDASLPGNALPVMPPVLEGPFVAVCNAEGDGWDTVEDYRYSIVVDAATGDRVPITEFGPLPEGLRYVPPELAAFEEARAAARKAVTQKRKAVEYGGFVFTGQRWDSEEKDELRLNSMMTMMEKLGITEFPGWKISADTFITLTPEIAMQAAVVMMQHYNACFAVEEAKKAEIDALERAEDIAAWLETSLNTGWPVVG